MNDSIHLQCRTAIRAIIAGLEEVQEVFRPEDIDIRRWPWNLEQFFPGVTIWDRRYSYADDGPVGVDDIIYSCPVTLIVSDEAHRLAHLDRLPQLERAIRLAFHNKRTITGLTQAPGARPGVTKVVPGFEFEPPKKAAWLNQLVEYRHILILAHVREVRPA